MRRFALFASFAIAACAADPPAPAPQAASPVRPAATPVSAPMPRPQGSPAQQFIQDYRQGPMQGSGDRPSLQPGEPARDNFDVGASGQGPVMPEQVSPAFRGL